MNRYSEVQDQLSTALNELENFNQRHTLGTTIQGEEVDYLSTARDAFDSAASDVSNQKAERELSQRVTELDQAIETMKEHATETDDIHLTSYDYVQVTIDWLEGRI